jgi:parvulin-like peptidyl-prolyl isomerase
MNKIIHVSKEEILHQIKISFQIPDLLKAIASRQIIYNAANEAGIKIGIQELQLAADQLRLANQLVKAEDTWAWLQKHHLTLDDFEELAYTNLLSQKLAIHLFADKAEQLFYEHQLDYTGVVTYEVILDDEDLAWELFYALQEGETTFHEIAHQYLENPESRRTGGYQGIRHRTDFRPEIAAAVFAAHPPQILKPIMTPKGANLILIEEIIQPEFNEQMRLNILGALFTNWLHSKLDELEIITQFENDNSSTDSANIMSVNLV